MTITPIRPERVIDAAQDLKLLDLFNDASTLSRCLARELERGAWLDAYLLVCGLLQLLEDDGSALVDLLRRATGYLGTAGSRRLAVPIRWALRIAMGRSDHRLRSSARTEYAASLRAFVGELAVAVVEAPDEASANRLRVKGRQLLVRSGTNSRVLPGGLLRMPSCFRSFDQRPEDLELLATRLVQRHPSRQRPMLVIGVRTSGSYLAPLLASYLQRGGIWDVCFETMRPGWPVDPDLRRAAQEVVRRHGVVVVVDDPPTTGGSIATAVGQLVEEADIPRRSIAIAIALFEDQPPSALAGLEVVSLAPREWSVRRHFEPMALADSLEELLERQACVESVQMLERAEQDVRGHMRALCNVTLQDGADGAVRCEQIVAEGTGLGYFGRQTLAVYSSAPQLFPEVFGWSDGLLFSRHQPNGGLLSPEADLDSVIEPIATHMASRRAYMLVDRDRSLELGGRQPAWEVAAQLVARSFGRAANVVRPLFVERAIRAALIAPSPSIVDGSAVSAEWVIGSDQGVLKAHFSEGPFGHHDLASYDTAFDLAAVAVSLDCGPLAQLLRARYEMLIGTPVEPERWMLLRLVHLWNEQRLERRSPSTTRRASSRVLEEFFSETLLDDVRIAEGPLVAIDLDGVLETSPLGFAATTRAGGLSLRSLAAHQFSVVIASGRSRSEIAERLDAYGLVGGVAEYGAYVVVRGRPPICTLDRRAEAALEQVRALLEGEPEIVVDGDYDGVVRCSRLEGRARRVGVGREWAETLLQRAGLTDELRVIDGEEQTDLAPVGVDKALGVRLLLRELGDDRVEWPQPLLSAIGDSESDLSLLQLAQHPFAPANASQTLRTGEVEVLEHAYQLGLAEASARLIGHRVGGCPRCRGAELAPSTERVIDLLSVQEGGPAVGARRTLGLALGGRRR